MTVADLIARISRLWRKPAHRGMREEELGAIRAFASQRWVIKSLLRYKRSGTGAVAEALSTDSHQRGVEQAFVARMTDCVLSRRGRRKE
jgi:hypothetical protein